MAATRGPYPLTPQPLTMETLLQDLRYALRQMRMTPAFAFFVVVTLAIGIGANTTIFAAVNAILLRPLPYAESERLVQVSGSYTGRGDEWSVSLPNAVDWQKQSHSFDDVAYFQGTGFSLAGEGTPERLEAVRSSGNLFSVLGVAPQLGRSYTTQEATPGAFAVAVLSDGFSRRRFGADPAILGRSLNLSGVPHTVVGVMPRGFIFPTSDVDLWVPLRANETTWNRGNGGLQVIGRLRAGVDHARARTDMAAVSARLAAAYPKTNDDLRAHIAPFRESLYGGEETSLMILMLLGAVGFVLLIACVNVANLLLARATSREREIAIRAAIGASRRRIMRQLLTESIVLALVGASAGCLLALGGTRLLSSVLPEGAPLPRDFTLDLRVLAFTAGLAVLTGILFGVAPALQSAGADLLHLIGGRSGAASRARKIRRDVLVVTEVALACVLLVAAGLMLRSLSGLLANDPGFRTANVLTMRVSLDAKYEDANDMVAFQDQVLASLRAQPGVEAAGAVDFLPLSGTSNFNDFRIEGSTAAKDENAGSVIVTPGYLDAMGIALQRGRAFGERDVRTAPGAAIVNRAFANKYWPGEDALGKRVLVGLDNRDNPYWRTVIGVVSDVRHGGLDQAPRAEMYIPFAQLPWLSSGMTLVARMRVPPLSMVGLVQKAVWNVDPALSLYEMRTIERVVRESSSVVMTRMMAGALGVFGLIALLLAAVGLYAVISYSVAQRTYEIGVRTALGARRVDVLKLVLGQGMSLVGAGMITGLVGALMVTRVLRSMLHNVTPTDPVAFAAMAAALISVALVATYVPARRAANIDPISALRTE
jgi:predicted permease